MFPGLGHQSHVAGEISSNSFSADVRFVRARSSTSPRLHSLTIPKLLPLCPALPTFLLHGPQPLPTSWRGQQLSCEGDAHDLVLLIFLLQGHILGCGRVGAVPRKPS